MLGATVLVAMMGDPAAFRSGREFAAWLGLVPRHSGTGGRVRMLGISKRGDAYLRTLLIHGARTALTRMKAQPQWQLTLSIPRHRARGTRGIMAYVNSDAQTAVTPFRRCGVRRGMLTQGIPISICIFSYLQRHSC